MVTDKIKGLGPLQTNPQTKPQTGPIGPDIGGPSFGETLKGLQDKGAKPAAGLEKLKFSNHAIERMRLRGVSFSPSEMEKIESAVSKARAKGAKDTLVLSDNSALIVSVKNNTVVTLMDRTNMKENVFTNIDSTVFAN